MSYLYLSRGLVDAIVDSFYYIGNVLDICHCYVLSPSYGSCRHVESERANRSRDVSIMVKLGSVLLSRSRTRIDTPPGRFFE